LFRGKCSYQGHAPPPKTRIPPCLPCAYMEGSCSYVAQRQRDGSLRDMIVVSMSASWAADTIEQESSDRAAHLQKTRLRCLFYWSQLRCCGCRLSLRPAGPKTPIATRRDSTYRWQEGCSVRQSPYLPVNVVMVANDHERQFSVSVEADIGGRLTVVIVKGASRNDNSMNPLPIMGQKQQELESNQTVAVAFNCLKRQ